MNRLHFLQSNMLSLDCVAPPPTHTHRPYIVVPPTCLFMYRRMLFGMSAQGFLTLLLLASVFAAAPLLASSSPAAAKPAGMYAREVV